MKTLGLLLIVGVLVVLALVYYPTQAKQQGPTLTINLAAQPIYHSSDSVNAHLVTGRPTVTASFINHILTLAHSPAQGIGTVMYQQGVKYGIDPVYILAFFHHESSFGLAGMARSTHSIGNIRCTYGYRCDPTGGYRSYPSYAVGVTDWYQLIASVYIPNGLNTVEKIIPVYAPTKDHNNEAAYIASVNADVALWREGKG